MSCDGGQIVEWGGGAEEVDGLGEVCVCVSYGGVKVRNIAFSMYFFCFGISNLGIHLLVLGCGFYFVHYLVYIGIIMRVVQYLGSS